MATQSQDPKWQEAQAARLAEYKKQRAAGAFDKSKTVEEKKATQQTIKAKGSPYLTDTYTKGVTQPGGQDRTSQWSTPKVEEEPTSPTQAPQQQQAGAPQVEPVGVSGYAEGQEISSPDLEGVEGIPTQRDYNKEQATIERLGLDPNTIMNLSPRKLLEATYTPEELMGMEDYKSLLNYEDAKASMEATPAPTNTMLAGLEDALRSKSDPANQKLGPSELFAQAGIPVEGVSGYATLSQAMNNQSQIMGDRYNSFVNQLSKTGGAMKDTYEMVADRYSLLKEDYDYQRERLDQITNNLVLHEQAMDLLDKQFDIDRAADEWARENPSYSEVTDRGRLAWDKKKFAFENADMIAEMEAVKNGYSKSNKAFKSTNAFGKGTVTGIDGSSKWEHGLDFVLEGGKGADVQIPISGEVIDITTGKRAQDDSGFGNQVKIRMADGREMWVSHLDSVNVQKGDIINAGTSIGTQGNTGSVYSLSGGDGTHLDITMTKPGGGYHSPREVSAYLDVLGKKQSMIGAVKGAGSGDAFDKFGNVVEAGTNLYNQFSEDKEVQPEPTLKQQWVDEFGDEPTKDELKSLEEEGVGYIDRVLKAKGKGDKETEAREFQDVQFIVSNEKFVDQFREKTKGMSKSAIKNAIKNSKTLQEKFGGKFSDYQIDLIYNAL